MAKRGRPKGSVSPHTKVLKEAILKAAEVHGRDGEGTDELEGYCYMLAKDHPNCFSTLLGKVLPMQIEGTGQDGTLTVKITK